MSETSQKTQEQRAVAAHVDGKLLHSEQDEGNLRVSDKSAFKKFKNAAKRIIVTREVSRPSAAHPAPQCAAQAYHTVKCCTCASIHNGSTGTATSLQQYTISSST
jgi:hypothetical protein